MHYSIAINQVTLPIVVRKHPRSRRMVIRYQPLTHSLTLTLPRYVSIRQGLSFIEERRGWIAQQLKEKPAPVGFTDGQVIPVLGEQVTIRHMGGRGVVRLASISPQEGRELLVPGDAAFLPRRVRDWLKQAAREEISRLAQEKSAILGKRVGKITLRDTSSHWGSCTQSGNLSFSWRLIFAPYAVLDYLVCHEVAHLAHLNHSPAFWTTVERLCPDYRVHKDWLSRYGNGLYGYK